VFGWFRKSVEATIAAVPALSADDLSCPFAFPVIGREGGQVHVFHAAKGLGISTEKSASRGRVPDLEIFTAEGEVWRALRLRSFARTGNTIFNHVCVTAAYEYARVRRYEFEELRAAARSAVENDPDDLWDQAMTHQEILDAIDTAACFQDLVRALDAALGG
jgi:hypothetical protein